MIKPLNNNCLIEVIDEYEGILHDTDADNVQKGILRNFQLVGDHLTASAGYRLYAGTEEYTELLNNFIGKIVYWQEYADAGGKFDIEGKKYVLVPFYRLIGVEE